MNVTTAFLFKNIIAGAFTSLCETGLNTQLHTDKANFLTNKNALCVAAWTTAQSSQLRGLAIKAHSILTTERWDETLERDAMSNAVNQPKHKRDAAASFANNVLANEEISLLGKFADIALGTTPLAGASDNKDFFDFFAGSRQTDARAASSGARKNCAPLQPDCVAHFDNIISSQPAFISPAAGAEVKIGRDGIASVETKPSKNFGSIHPATQKLWANENQRQQEFSA